MKSSRSIAALLMACCLAPMAFAQPKLEVSPSEEYVPRLGDIMNAVQTRHIKLSLAGKAQNWELAAYELRQLKAGLLEAAVMYPGIPVTNVTTMTAPVQAIADAIAARDSQRFVKASGELWAGCNSCHQSMERGFIAIQAPTAAPFGDQSFAPRGK
jgi:ornithine carbamoyltransferase